MAAGETNLGVVMGFSDGGSAGSASSTTTAPATELIDFNNLGQTEAFNLGYNLASSPTTSLDGQWSTSLNHVARGGAFKIAAAGGAGQTIGHIPGRMPLGV
jgi:hypothetical protein